MEKSYPNTSNWYIFIMLARPYEDFYAPNFQAH